MKSFKDEKFQVFIENNTTYTHIYVNIIFRLALDFQTRNYYYIPFKKEYSNQLEQKILHIWLFWVCYDQASVYIGKCEHSTIGVKF